MIRPISSIGGSDPTSGSRIARSSATSAASRYFSTWLGEMFRAEPTLSKPKPISSGGKASARWRSSPRRSRIVLSYSCRFKRRITTGGAGPPRPTCAARKSSSTQATTASRSAAVGCGESFGGIAPPSIWSRTLGQIRPSATAAAPSANRSRTTPASGSSAEWQSTQYRWRIGATCRRNASSPRVAPPPASSKEAARPGARMPSRGLVMSVGYLGDGGGIARSASRRRPRPGRPRISPVSLIGPKTEPGRPPKSRPNRPGADPRHDRSARPSASAPSRSFRRRSVRVQSSRLMRRSRRSHAAKGDPR